MTPEQLKAKFPNASTAFIKANGDLLGVLQNAISLAELPIQPKPKRIRQQTKPLLNKLETEFKQRLSFLYSGRIIDQGIRFRLANGLHYTPDFTVFSRDAPHLTGYEVKGPHAWDDSIAKLKMAARAYPEITWVLCWKKDGQWLEQTVLP